MEREVRTEVPSSSEPRAVVLGLLPVDCSDTQARLPRPRPGHEDLHEEAGGMGRRDGQAGRAGGAGRWGLRVSWALLGSTG